MIYRIFLGTENAFGALLDCVPSADPSLGTVTEPCHSIAPVITPNKMRKMNYIQLCVCKKRARTASTFCTLGRRASTAGSRPSLPQLCHL